MPKFTFIGEHTDLYGNPDGTKVTYEFEVDTLENILEHANLFIRGCGYFPQGTLDYIPDSEYYGSAHWEPDIEWTGDGHDGMGSTMADYPELYDEQDLPMGKSKHYFDTERNK